MTRRWRAVLVTVALVVAASTATSTTSAASARARPASSQLDRNAFVHGPGQTTPPPLAAGLSSATALSCPGGDSWEYAARSETIGVVVEVYCSDSRGKGVLPPAPGVRYQGYFEVSMDSFYEDFAMLDNKDRHNARVDFGDFDVQYCSLHNGSDLPGAVFKTKVELYEPAHFDITDQYTLPDDKTPPVLSVGSTPPHGAKVHPGEVIKVHITATEPTDRGPQEGIQDIQLLGPDGLVDSAQYGNHPKACDLSRLTKTFTTTYTVPNNPPPVIRLTAVAHDFVNNESATLSADFPTGDVWTGTAQIVTHITDPPLCPSTSVEDSTFNLVVGSNGAVKGTRTWVIKATSCGAPTTSGPVTFPQFGQVSGGKFHLTDLVVDLHDVTIVPISSSGTTATASITGGPYHDGSTTSTWTGTIKLTEG